MDSTSVIAAVGNNTSIIFGEATEIAKYCKTMPIFGGNSLSFQATCFHLHALPGGQITVSRRIPYSWQTVSEVACGIFLVAVL